MNVFSNEALRNANAFYQEGYDAGDSTLSPYGVRRCPYKEHTFAYSEWWRGLSDSTFSWIAWMKINR